MGNGSSQHSFGSLLTCCSAEMPTLCWAGGALQDTAANPPQNPELLKAREKQTQKLIKFKKTNQISDPGMGLVEHTLNGVKPSNQREKFSKAEYFSVAGRITHMG